MRNLFFVIIQEPYCVLYGIPVSQVCFINKSASNKQRNIKKCIINKVITLITADDSIIEIPRNCQEFPGWILSEHVEHSIVTVDVYSKLEDTHAASLIGDF